MEDIRPTGQVFEFNNSPIMFVLTAPAGEHRQAVARSAGETLDLIGLDTGIYAGALSGSIRLGRSMFLTTPAKFDLRTFHVEADIEFATNTSRNGRASHLGFSWRGLARKDDLDEISHLFRVVSSDLYASVLRGNRLDVEWQLSTLVLACANATRISRRRLRRMRFATWIVVAVYIVFAAFLFLRTSEYLDHVK